ncbi:MAG: FAD-binding oxidoreductase, partial [Candidatus Hydrogenedentes bacterium]|nr:FAD-binding oxidoreductase [Candidatus Hydrogenedentota bacterium]
MSLAGWGRYKPVPCTAYRPERSSELNSFLDTPPPSFIARGLGRSYGDAAVNEDGALLDMTRLNRMQSFDAATGVLECEGGVSLAEILEVFVPRGFFLSVTPGTKFVTVAGAIANDVHGKNHHCDGTFTQFVDSIELWTPARGVLTCSREENSDIFWATAGGVGLTGIILSATLRLRPVESAYMQVDYKQCSHLDEALEAMAASDKDYLYSVAWVDCLAKGTSLGRSILMRGNHA